MGKKKSASEFCFIGNFLFTTGLPVHGAGRPDPGGRPRAGGERGRAVPPRTLRAGLPVAVVLPLPPLLRVSALQEPAAGPVGAEALERPIQRCSHHMGRMPSLQHQQPLEILTCFFSCRCQSADSSVSKGSSPGDE